MAILDLYLLGHRVRGEQEVRPGRTILKSDLAVSFTEGLARYMFDFAEHYIHCSEGDEIHLLQARMHCQDIIGCTDFIHQFRERISAGSQLEMHSTLDTRPALCPGSEEARRRRREDLLSVHQDHARMFSLA
ncbi:hypothetical protein [Marinobacterium litorale]|jgi:hypothetical protein|uniref:hypothetical protein n=1 Tax=Marinobacterium litorale TaxID=404770 RepID=UPI0004123495|nr:hypothetical protein [Marinobacterium litorale]